MSLTGIVNTHTMAATLLMTHGDEEQKQRWLPAHGDGRAARRASRSPSPTPAATPATSPAGRPATARSTSSTAPRRGSPTASGRRSSRWPRAPTRASRAFIVEKEPGHALRGHHASARHVGKLGYKGVETVEMAYADHRIPAGQPGRRGRAGPAPDPRRAGDGPHQHRGPCRRGGPSRLRRRPRLRPAARARWASRSPSTRRSSSSWPTWRPGSRRRGC